MPEGCCVNERLMGVMAEEMARYGDLARLDACCGGGCGGCHAAAACATSPSGITSEAAPGALLILTAKRHWAAIRE